MTYLKHFVVLLLLVTLVSCSKKATCSDGIKNQNETSIDCGGPCAPCGTCSDGIKNQDETAVDCGGVCSVCQTCSDGIQNQGETGIDCGGPCGTCPVMYPESDIYGPNILRNDTITIVQSVTTDNSPKHYYSMSAKLPSGASLKVIMSFTMSSQTDFGSNGWYYNSGSVNGWSAGLYTSSQQFIASGPSNAILSIEFVNHGNARIDIYENGATAPTRTKLLNW